jgi:hypothetical protein
MIFVVLIPALLELQVPPAATLILTSTVFVPELYAKVLPRPMKLIWVTPVPMALPDD